MLSGCRSDRALRATAPLMLLLAFLFPAAVGAQTLPVSICLEVESADYHATTTIQAPGTGNTITHRPALLTWRWCDPSTDPPTAKDIPSNVAGFRFRHKSTRSEGDVALRNASVSGYCASNECTCELRVRGTSAQPVIADTPAPTGNVCSTMLWGNPNYPREGRSWHYWIWAYNSEGTDIARGLVSGVQHTLPVNKAPRFLEESPTRTVAEAAQAGESVGAPVSATDPEGSTLTYSLGGDDGSSFAIDSATGQLTVGQGTTFDHSTKSSYSVQVTANDGHTDTTTNSASIDVTINVTPNQPPTVSASCAPCSVTPGGVARLTASAADADGGTLTYAWSAAAGSFDGSTTESTARWTAPGALGPVTIRVDVSDGQGGSAAAEVTIVVKRPPPPANAAPRFEEGSSTTRRIAENSPPGSTVGAPVTATDLDGEMLTYSLGGADAASFAVGSRSGQITVGAGTTLDYETRTGYSVTVYATDGKQAASILVTIAVIDLLEFDEGGSTTRRVAENSPPGSTVGAPVTATGPDGDTLTYSLGGADAGSFAIDPLSGQITVGDGTLLDYETRTGYSVTVHASAGTETASIRVAIAVIDLLEFDAGSSTTRRVAENSPPGSTVGAPVTATDPDGDPLTYSLGGADAGSFAIDPHSGQITVGDGTVLDYESTSRYRVTVYATDGTEAASIQVTIAVIDVLDFDEGGSTTRRVAENSPPGSTVGAPVTATHPDGDRLFYWLGGADAHHFAIDLHSGQITVGDGTVLDYESTSRYRVTVYTSDGRVATSIPVTIEVIDLLEFDEGGSTTRRVAEHSPFGSRVGAPVTAADPDGDTLFYWLGGADAHHFAIDPHRGQITVGYGTVLDYETRTGYSVTVNASDGTETASILVTIAVIDVLEFDEGDSTTRRVAKYSPPGSRVGAPVTATHPDGDPLTYSLGGADAHRFAIDPQSGQITVGDGTVLDYETRTGYSVTVNASDGTETASILVAIAVFDVLEFDEGSSTTRQVAENSPPGSRVGAPVTATDPDGDPLTYSLGGADAHRFAIDPQSGQVTVGSGATLDYETTSSYRVTVSVTDGVETASIDLLIHVTDIGPPPAPDPPVVSPVSGSASSLAVRWAAPRDADPAITDYDLRYRLSGRTGWTAHPLAGASTTTTIAGLTPQASYDVQVRAINIEGASAWSAPGTGSVYGLANEALLTTILAALGRQMMGSVTAAIGRRFDAQPVSAARVTLGGHASPSTLLGGSAFQVPLGATGAAGTRNGAARSTLWGRGGLGAFRDRPVTGGHFAGNVATGYLGVDFRSGRRLLGAALSHGWSETDYTTAARAGAVRGKLATTLTAVHPYLHWSSEAGSAAWTVLGLGTGTATVSVPGARRPAPSHLTHALVAGGVRQTTPAPYPVEFAIRADGGMARIKAENGEPPLAGVEAGVWRARVGLESAWEGELDDGTWLAVFGESSGRFDGGDGVNGAGLELAGGMRFAGAGVEVEARGRILALHTAEDYREHGVGVTARVTPDARGRGLSLSLGTRHGGATGGAETLWREALPLGGPAAAGGWTLDAQIGYGVAVPGSDGVLTPFGEASVARNSRRWKLGTRFTTPRGLALELAGERSDADGGGEHELSLNLHLAL